MNNGRLVRFPNPLWKEMTRETTAAASWAVARRTPGALLIRERETRYLLNGEYMYNVNSGTVWLYTFLVVVISSRYFPIYSVFVSLWNSRSTCLSLLKVIVSVFSESKFPDNFYCSSFSLILYLKEPVISDKCFKRLSPTVIFSLYVVWSFSWQSSSSSKSASADHWWSAWPIPSMTDLMWLTLC